MTNYTIWSEGSHGVQQMEWLSLTFDFEMNRSQGIQMNFCFGFGLSLGSCLWLFLFKTRAVIIKQNLSYILSPEVCKAHFQMKFVVFKQDEKRFSWILLYRMVNLIQKRHPSTRSIANRGKNPLIWRSVCHSWKMHCWRALAHVHQVHKPIALCLWVIHLSSLCHINNMEKLLSRVTSNAVDQ